MLPAKMKLAALVLTDESEIQDEVRALENENRTRGL